MKKVGQIVGEIPNLVGSFKNFPGVDPTLTQSGAAADAMATGKRLADHEARLILQERNVDKTLTVSGVAADAKVTGDKFAEHEKRLKAAENSTATAAGAAKTLAEHEERLATQEQQIAQHGTMIDGHGRQIMSMSQVVTEHDAEIEANKAAISSQAQQLSAQAQQLAAQSQQIADKVDRKDIQEAVREAAQFGEDANAVHYTPDNMTEEAKAQARANIGAEAAGAVTAHNVADDAHGDIRSLISNLTAQLEALANTDEESLAKIEEMVAYIESNKDLIESITTGKVNVSDIVDNLTTSVSDQPLSAKMGVQLKALIDAITIPTSLPASDVYAWAKAANKPTYTASEVGASATGHKHTKSEITDFPTAMTPTAHTHKKSEITDFPTSMPASDVYAWAKAANKPSYTASEVGASPTGHKHTKAEITDFPTEMKPSAHNHDAADINAGTLGAERLPILPVSKGGTGAEDAATARANLGAAAAADIAKTATYAMSNSSSTYAKISGFGAWGTGAWYAKGFSMLITSRAGEMIWLAVSSNDSNTDAKAIRLLNTYSKLNAVYYSISESAVYVKVAAWCNNVNAHILSNVNGDYVPTVAAASALPSDAVQVTITEFGAGSGATNIGDSSRTLTMTGSGDRPTYNGNGLALQSEIPAYSNATTAADGLMSKTDKLNLETLMTKTVTVHSGAAAAMTAAVGGEGDIYLVTE